MASAPSDPRALWRQAEDLLAQACVLRAEAAAAALAATGWRIRRAAALLGVPIASLMYKLAVGELRDTSAAIEYRRRREARRTR